MWKLSYKKDKYLIDKADNFEKCWNHLSFVNGNTTVCVCVRASSRRGQQKTITVVAKTMTNIVENTTTTSEQPLRNGEAVPMIVIALLKKIL